jgi:hypothetical protein
MFETQRADSSIDNFKEGLMSATPCHLCHRADVPERQESNTEREVMTLAAVSRAFRSLTTRGIIKVRNRRHVRIIDRDGFEKIAGDPLEALAS